MIPITITIDIIIKLIYFILKVNKTLINNVLFSEEYSKKNKES